MESTMTLEELSNHMRYEIGSGFTGFRGVQESCDVVGELNLGQITKNVVIHGDEILASGFRSDELITLAKKAIKTALSQ